MPGSIARPTSPSLRTRFADGDGPNPALVDENGVLICGHGRIRAAAKLGLTSIPVMVAVGARRRSAPNAWPTISWRPVEAGTWSCSARSFRTIGASDFDLGLIGFEPDQLARLLAGFGSSGLTDPDSVPAVPD